MGKAWRDCIVTLIDVSGTKKAADPATLMRRLHAMVASEKPKLSSIDHSYAWNDSVLLLSFVDRTGSYSLSMQDAETLKRRIDCYVAKSYAIAVKGQAFPPGIIGVQKGVTVIKASSWAMANCFEVEQESRRRRWLKPWYVDIRIARQIQTSQGFEEMEVPSMLGAGGRRRPRKIRAYCGYLWN
jgi:hypothetical protein